MLTDKEKELRNSIGGIWGAASIEEEPEIILRGVTIYEVSSTFYKERTRHFSGYNIYGFEGRASSPIIEFDCIKKIGKTQSGRTYKILNEKARFSEYGDISYVWNFMVKRDNLFDIIDVTHEVLNVET